MTQYREIVVGLDAIYDLQKCFRLNACFVPLQYSEAGIPALLVGNTVYCAFPLPTTDSKDTVKDL